MTHLTVLVAGLMLVSAAPLAAAQTYPDRPIRVIARLHEVIIKVVRASDTRSRIEALGAEPAGTSPVEFAAMIRKEYTVHEKIVRLAGVKVD